MAWDEVQAAAERDANVADFVEAQPYLRWGTGRRLAVAVAVFAAGQLLPAMFLVAMWNKDRAGVLFSLGALDVLCLGVGGWFVLYPLSYARVTGRWQYPKQVDPGKWNPWLGGGG